MSEAATLGYSSQILFAELALVYDPVSHASSALTAPHGERSNQLNDPTAWTRRLRTSNWIFFCCWVPRRNGTFGISGVVVFQTLATLGYEDHRVIGLTSFTQVR